MNDQIVRYFLGELSSAEKIDLFRQMDDNPEAKEEFAKLQNTWALAASSTSKNDPKTARPYLQDFRKRQNRKKTQIFLINLSKYAAVLLIGMLIARGFIGKNPTQEKAITAYQQLTVPAGQRSMLTLADGTTVWVNARSTLVYPGNFDGNTREVTLIGEAYFEVAPNREQPFIVKSGDFCTQVTGTQFNVFAYDGFYDVSLIEGQVKVYETGKNDTIVLNRLDKVAWTDGHFVKSVIDDTDDFLWKEGIYYFDDDPFPVIIEKLQLYYDVQIQVTNEEVSTRKYTGKFRQRDGIESVLRVMQKVYPFSYQRDEDKNVIIIK